ncbi:MAG TPA: serine/threonine-protein phosphatase, partial [Magnetococcales bacterium]|nr:serine/threonine-protein phosphatase [Magnetococcales bacterium]
MAYLIGDRLRVAGRTDVGCVRTLNEDFFSIDDRAGILLVADGMGGHEAGEVASARVVDLVRSSLAKIVDSPPVSPVAAPLQPTDHDHDDPTLDEIPNPVLHMVRKALHAANADVNLTNQDRGFENGTGMGTTVVGLWLPRFSDSPVVFHVGDSRLYLYRNPNLAQLTQDHSMYQHWLSMGKKGPRPAQNILLQAIGPSKNFNPDVHFHQMVKGDVILLCSDGLYGMIGQDDLVRLLGK